MIYEFKEGEARTSGLIYRSTLNQIKSIYKNNPSQAGELAISAIELVLTGQISSDDEMVNIILEQNKEINQKNIHSFELKQEQAKQRKIADQKLDEIARMAMAKKTQKEIAVKLGLSQQTVSNRIALIRKDYGYLLQEKEPVQEKNTCTNEYQLVQSGTSENQFVQEKTVDACTSKKSLVQGGTSNEELVQDWRTQFNF